MSEIFSEDEVKGIANLACIDLRDDEIKRLTSDLNIIRKSISSVTEAVKLVEDKTGKKVEPTSHPLKLETVLREDEIATLENDLLTAKEAVSSGPKVENNQFVAPQILGED